MDIRETIRTLAMTLVEEILGAVRTSPLSDITGQGGGPKPKAAVERTVKATSSRVAKAAVAEAASPLPTVRGSDALLAYERAIKTGSSKLDDATKAQVSHKTTKRLPRRTADQIGQGLDSIVALLTMQSHGLRAEQIRKALGLDARELPRILKEGLDSKKIRIASGQKRATTYAPALQKNLAASPKNATPKAKGPVKVAAPKPKAPTKTAKAKKKAEKAPTVDSAASATKSAA